MAETLTLDNPATEALTVTAALAHRISAVRLGSMPPAALTVAKQCLLDWIGVALAGRGEPLVRHPDRRAGARPTIAAGVAILGHGRRARLDDAVLINGAMGHALDFDDVIMPMGHPTVPVAPVVLALAEQQAALRARRRWWPSSPASRPSAASRGCSDLRTTPRAGTPRPRTGTFGAAAAAARLLGVEGEALTHAFGLAGTQAAGLKSCSGPCPSRCTRARRRRTACWPRGWPHAASPATPTSWVRRRASPTPSRPPPIRPAALADRAQPWVVEALFKYHAACYLTHDSIEAANPLRARGDDIAGGHRGGERKGSRRPPRRLQHPGPADRPGVQVFPAHDHRPGACRRGHLPGGAVQRRDRPPARPGGAARQGRASIPRRSAAAAWSPCG